MLIKIKTNDIKASLAERRKGEKRMKKSVLRVFTVFMILTLLLSSCGSYTPPVGGENSEQSSGNNSPVIELPDGVNENTFTVSLYSEGKKYIPAPNEEIFAQWTDGFSVFRSKIESDGFARVEGLDGDYTVTISEAPSNYTYNPNIYLATNDSKHIAIELKKVNELSPEGNGIYTAIDLTDPGVYRLEFTSPDESVFVQLRPISSGKYSIESWADTVANNLNPTADVYNGSSEYKYFSHTLNDGGATSSYTKNIRYEVSVDESEVGKVFTLALKLSSRDGVYPQYLDFALMLEGEFSRDRISSKLVYPEEDLGSFEIKEYDKSVYKIVGAETTADGRVLFDADMYRLYSRENGGDGYYHLYDEVLYAENGGYGPTLYAYVSSACQYIDRAFSALEYVGNQNLTLFSGTENYKLFIEGFDGIVSKGGSYYFCLSDCPCRIDKSCCGACSLECAMCKPDCRKLPKDKIGAMGYADVCNSDGLCPVTAELKDFLQKYSESQMLFLDGVGFVAESGVYASEDARWLFACAYYVEK